MQTPEFERPLILSVVKCFQVDDEKSILAITKAKLAEIGIDVVGSGTNLEEALLNFERVANEKPIDVCILDQKFPTGTVQGHPPELFLRGIELLKDRPSLRLLRSVVLFSGTAKTEDMESLKQNFPQYTFNLLQKPPLSFSLIQTSVIDALWRSGVVSMEDAGAMLERILDKTM